MKNIIMVSIFTIAMFCSFLIVSYAEETDNLKILGITLGKSIVESGIRECKLMNASKLYDSFDINCYQRRGTIPGMCFTELIPDLSFSMVVYFDLLVQCDIKSPIQEIQGTFHSDNFENVLLLTTGKFGKPHKTQKSIVQNKMDAKFDRIEYFWNIKGHSINLTNISSKVDRGALIIIHRDKIKNNAEKSKEKNTSDSEKF